MMSAAVKRCGQVVVLGLSLTLIWHGKLTAGTGHDSQQSRHEGKPESLETFGPGDSFHLHKTIHPEDYKQVADIARHPDDLPPPIAMRPPETVEVNLVAREVVSEIAPGIRFHYWTFNDTVPVLAEQ